MAGGVSTRNKYSGYVALSISGTGTAAGDSTNDAFYFVNNPAAGCETEFVMRVWLSGQGSPRPLASLMPDGCPDLSDDHTYEVTINLGSYVGPLKFGTGEVGVWDNTGELVVSLTQTVEPTPTPTPTPLPAGPFVFAEVDVVSGRPPDRTAQLSYDSPACRRAVPPLRLREDSGIDDTVDLDVLYVSREPVYGYRQAKTFPDVGEFVTYTAYVANRGGVDTSESASEISVNWEMLSPSGDVLFDFTEAYELSLPPNAVAAFKVGWFWEDGPNRLIFEVDPGKRISEWTPVNNSVEIFTNALLVGLAFEESFYDWMSSVMNGDRGVGRFYWFTRDPSSPPHRPEVFGAESWAQRQVEQMNEYFRQAEDDYFNGVRHRLPRVALQAVPVVPERQMVGDNSGLPANGPWGDLDLVWGFQATFPQKHFPPECRTPGPQGAWTWLGYYHPQNRTVEDSLIHELGHHMALRHEDEIYGEYVFVPGSAPMLLGDGMLAVPPGTEFRGDRQDVIGVMVGGDYWKGLSKYAAHTMAYRFQSIPNRDVPSRIGAISGGGGNGIPRIFGNYWDSYETRDVWDWVEFEQPDPVRLIVADGDGKAVPEAKIDLHSLAPLPEEAIFPPGLPVPFSARWEGWFVPPSTGRYTFFTYSLGNVRVVVGDSELVDDFRHGQHPTNTIFLVAGRRYPILIELDSSDIYGGQRFMLSYKCPECPGAQDGPREFRTEDLWTVDRGSNGLDVTFWDGPGFGASGERVVAHRMVPGPRAFPRDHLAFSETPTIGGVTSGDGALSINPNVLFPPGSGRSWVGGNRTAVVIIRFNDQEFVRILSLADMNLAFWSGSQEPTTAMKLDGTRDGFPALLLVGEVP